MLRLGGGAQSLASRLANAGRCGKACRLGGQDKPAYDDQQQVAGLISIVANTLCCATAAGHLFLAGRRQLIRSDRRALCSAGRP